jgi:hypothetical protein
LRVALSGLVQREPTLRASVCASSLISPIPG